jgi:uncharacterized protein (TIGR02147 family)
MSANSKKQSSVMAAEFPWELSSSVQILQSLVQQKSRSRAFSFRALAQKCGFSTPNYIQLLASGKKSFTEDSLNKIALVLKLQSNEIRYWSLCLQLDLCVTQGKRVSESLLAEMSSLRGKHSLKALTRTQDVLFENWYTPIIWAFAELLKTPSEQESLAKSLGISELDLKHSLGSLVNQGFLTSEFNLPKNELLEMKTQASREKLTQYFAENFKKMSSSMQKRQFARVSTLSARKESLAVIQSKVRDFQIQLMEEFNSPIENSNDFCVLQLAVAGFLFQIE